MKLIKVPTVAVVLFLITTGAIILKGPKTEPAKDEPIHTEVLQTPTFSAKSMPVRVRLKSSSKR